MTKIDSPSLHPGCVTVAWGGDVNIGRRFHYRSSELGPNAGLAGIAPLREADLGIVNLECVVATRGEQGIDKNERSSYYYRARPEMLKTLVDAGVDMVATANNHSGDYGPEALLEQSEWLDAVGIAHAGSGANLDEALRPAIRRAGALNIALFAFDATQPSFGATAERPGQPYISLSDPEKWREMLAPLIEDARRQAHIVLVAVHWGANNQTEPSRNEVAVGHAIIDAGADAILGASAHVLQGVEVYKGRPIIHDAGDLLFDAVKRESSDSGIFTLEIDGSGVRRVRFRPVEVSFCRSVILEGPLALASAQRFLKRNAVFGTAFTVTSAGECILELSPPARTRAELPAAPLTTYNPAALKPLSAPLPEWVVDDVPEDVRLEAPVRLGPLELIGAKMTPEVLDSRGLVYVESYWRLVEPTSEDWRLDFRAHPEKTSDIRSWGISCDHDPCDWMWPTSRWEPGKIYKDYYNLRPQRIAHWQDTKLQLSIRIKSNTSETNRIFLPISSQFCLNSSEALSVLRASVPKYGVFPKEKLAAGLPDIPDQIWTAEQLAQVTGGKWLVPPPPGWYVRSISHKSAVVTSGEAPKPMLFVAMDKRIAAQHELYSSLSGINWDSHDRVAKLQAHTGGAIVTRPVEGLDPSFPLLQVTDSMRALIELGAASRQRLKGHVVAITGSSGKTSLTSMLSRSMAADKRVKSTVANYNSRTGILYLLANTPAETDLVVMEAAVSAINAPGFQNIKLVRPDIAIITNIAPSHLASGKTLAYVAERKANILEGVAKGGWAVIYREAEYFEYLCNRARRRELNILTYGSGSDADIQLEDFDPMAQVARVRLPTGERLEYSLAAKGRHTAINSLACIAVRHILGYEMEPYLPALKLYKAEAGRGEVHDVQYRGKKLTVTDESYNANPLSMKMALESMRAETAGGGGLVILGDMLELGDEEVRYHRELADQIQALKPDRVLLCGSLMKHLWEKLQSSEGYRPDGEWYKDASVLNKDLDRWLIDGDRILVKASNSIRLSSIVERLTEKDGTGAGEIAANASVSNQAQARQSAPVRNLGAVDPAPSPSSNVSAGLLMDLRSGERLSERNASHPISGRHLSQLLLLTLAAERLTSRRLTPDEAVAIKPLPRVAARGAPTVGLSEGDKATVTELIRAIVVCNARDAAYSLAVHLSGSATAALEDLRSLAGMIGMENTVLRNLSGRVQAGQQTTLEDISRLVAYLYRRHPHRLSWFTAVETVVGGKLFRSSGNLVASGMANFAFGSGGTPRWGFAISRIGDRAILSCAAGAHDAFNLDYQLDSNLALAEEGRDHRSNAIPAHFSVKEHRLTAGGDAPRINFLGDTYFGEWYSRRRQRRGVEDALTRHGYDHSFLGLKQLLDEGDFNIANFEAALSSRQDTDMKGRKPFVLVGDPDASVAALQRHRIHAVSLGNNHAIDAGVQGLDETLNAFDAARIARFGAGQTAKEAERPLVLRADGQTYKIFSAYWYRRYMEQDCAFYALPRRGGAACLSGGLLDAIRAEKKKDDPAKIIVLAHWGSDYLWTGDTQRSLSRQLVEAGADLIVGSGTHMLGEFEQQEGRWVVHSIGNGIFNSDGEYRRHNVPPFSFVAQLMLDRRAPQLRLYPIFTNNLETFWQPRPVTTAEFEQVLKVLSERGTAVARERKGGSAWHDKDAAGRHLIVLPFDNLRASENDREEPVAKARRDMQHA